MILIISHPGDGHTQIVTQALRARGVEPALLDFSRFPARSTISLRYGNGRSMILRDDAWGEVDLSQCGSVWWRRPQPFEISSEVSDPIHRMFATSEAREVFGGLSGLMDARWINLPARDDLAHRKVFQLRAAERVGLSIPDTLVTNAPEAARDFIAHRGPGQTVFKPFSGTPQAWRETRLIGPDELERLDLVRMAPLIFQEYVSGVDIRVTVVGERIFAAAIDIGNGDYPVDFRMNYEHIQVQSTDLPDGIQAGIRRLMEDLGLVYGAIDFRRTSDDRYLFLEINPAGQWLFIEQHTHQSITEAMTDTLIAFDS